MPWRAPHVTRSEGSLPVTIPPSQWQERDNGANGRDVTCGGCGRTRAFGVRCQCERWTPDGQPISEDRPT